MHTKSLCNLHITFPLINNLLLQIYIYTVDGGGYGFIFPVMSRMKWKQKKRLGKEALCLRYEINEIQFLHAF